MSDDRRLETAAGAWDCSAEEREFIGRCLAGVTYTDYDRLIQLCDCLALPTGLCLVEKRFVDVTMRHGLSEFTLSRWRAYLVLQAYFERMIGRSIYSVLPGIIGGTFGFMDRERSWSKAVPSRDRGALSSGLTHSARASPPLIPAWHPGGSGVR